MGKPVLIFFATTLISFLGSLQLGPANLTVIQSVLRRNLQAGLWIALGGCLPEMLYAGAAVWAGMWLEQHQQVWVWFERATIPLLLIVGVIIFVTPNRPITLEKTQQNSLSFVKGLTIGILNPQLFPYWLVILVQFNMHEMFRVQTLADQISFVAGTATGALGLLVGVAYLTMYFRERLIAKLAKFNTNRFLGALFMLLGLGQLLRLYFKT